MPLISKRLISPYKTPGFSWQSYWTTQNVLDTVNTFNGIWSGGNGNYLYGCGVTNFTDVLRKAETGQTVETRGAVTSIDAGFTIFYKIYTTSIANFIFVLVRKNPGNFHLLKSADGGATFTDVFTFGEGNGLDGADSINVRLLKGILETSEGTLYFGEYNVNGTRTAGSTNDRVRIMKSVDRGDTWTKVTEWNTNGSNQVGHIHAMVQDPHTHEIYICTGDVDNKAGIIKWDGVSAWEDNKTLAQIGMMPGFTVLTGSQRYRVCDVLFDENYFYTFADTQKPNNPTGSESGIWRGTKDFSSYTRVDNQIFDYDPMHIGWLGEKVGNTFIFTTSREYIDGDNAWSQLNTHVYMSNDGVNWYKSNVLNWRDTGDATTTLYINNVFQFNNKFYIDCTGGAGFNATIQCTLSKQWRDYEDAVILHPVYFVGTWNASGNDSNNGQTADAPKLTLNNILILNRICAGARVKVASGNFSETNIYPIWSGAAYQGRGSVVIEGQGRNLTHIIRSSGSGNTYGIYIEAARTLTSTAVPLIFKDLDFYITVDGVAGHSNHVIRIIDSSVKTIGCKIGDITNDDSPLVQCAGVGTKYESINSVHVANVNSSAFKYIVQFVNNCEVTLKNSVIQNGYDCFNDARTGVKLTLINCTLYNVEQRGVVLQAGWNVQPVIKNCIFNCGVAPIRDEAGITEDSVDYNVYNKANINVTDGGHSLAIGTNPMFVDAANGDFNLKSSSPCRRKGVYIATLLYDFVNRTRRNPPAIGAYDR